MSSEFDWQKVSVIVTLCAALLTVFLFMLRAALNQFEARLNEKFKRFDDLLAGEREQLKRLETQVNDLSRILPMEYVRREDWIRFSAVIDAKLDRTNERIAELPARLRG